MNDDRDKAGSEADADLEREIREGRKFTPQEALARLAGPGAMKGASPVSLVQQAETQIGLWLKSHMIDPEGALHAVLHRHLKGSGPLLDRLDQPLAVLADYCQRILASEQRLEDLVREADVEWGRMNGERPRFQKPGEPPHPDDPYSSGHVREVLVDAVRQIERDAGA